MSIEAMKQVIELYDKHCYNNDYGGIEFNIKHGYKFIEAIEALRTAIQQAESEPVAWPLRAQVWKRESTQEWVLEIAGTLGDTDMNIRHTQPLSVAYENVPGLPTFYTHPAPGVPDALKDHQIAAMVNTLRDIARQFHGHDSLRERIANVLVPALKAEANADEPVAWIRRHPNGALSNELLTHVQVEQVRRDSGAWVPLYTHPAPSVPGDVVRDAERYRFIRDADVSDDLIPDIALYAMESLDEYIDAAMLAAKEASA